MEKFTSMLSALGQAARLKIFRLLIQAGPEGACVEDIRKRVRIPGSTLSHHLDTLARCGLLKSSRESRFIYYTVDWRQVGALLRFLTEDCCAGLNASAGKPIKAGPPAQPTRKRAGRPLKLRPRRLKAEGEDT